MIMIANWPCIYHQISSFCTVFVTNNHLIGMLAGSENAIRLELSLAGKLCLRVPGSFVIKSYPFW